MNPFGDSRDCLAQTVWTFNLDKGILLFDKKDQHRQLSLDLLPQLPDVNSAYFEPYDPPAPPNLDLGKAFPAPYWTPKYNIAERNKSFVSRVLEDFSYQWRHILRACYNDLTFRRLARAIIRIAMLDFTVTEVATARRGEGGFLVWIHSLPEWEPFSDHITRIGGVRVVLSQDPTKSLSSIQKDFANQRSAMLDPIPPGETTTYIILSVRHIILCHVDDEKLRYTQPEELLNGTKRPSKRAVELLLSATHSEPPFTRLHSLPLELQDRILGGVSLGPVEGARVGCMLDLGSPFAWKDGGREIEREEGHRNRTPWTPVESQIYFGGSFSGLAYK